MKKTILFIHDNPDSSGSFVEKTLNQIKHLRERYRIVCMLPQEGVFSRRLAGADVEIIYRSLHENEGIISYFFNVLAFRSFLKSERVNLIYFLDFVWWKPAEILAAKWLQIPMLAFIGFYKDQEAKKSFLGKMDAIVANSNKTAESLQGFGWKKKTHVIHNFVDVSRFKEVKSIRTNLANNGELILAYVGILDPIKGIKYLIEAIPEINKEISNLKCIFVGYEKEKGALEKLKKLVSEHRLEETVSFLGQRDDIPEIMRSIDLLVVPSLDEPFGYVNIEAGAVGIPVVATNVGGIPEIIIDGETGFLVEAKNSAAIAERCVELLSSEEKRKTMGACAKKRVEEHFSKERILLQWEELISALIN